MLYWIACATPDEEGPGSLDVGEPVACADPDLREALGPFEETDLGGDWSLQAPVGWEGEYHLGEALAIEDFDGDDRLDVLVPDNSALRYYRGPDWEEESGERIPALPETEDGVLGLSTVTAADLDGDGDLDLLLTITRGAHQVLENDGDGIFTAIDMGFTEQPYHPRGAPMGDLDGDGDLDLLVVNDRIDELPPDPGEPNQLFLNGGTFTDISDRLSYEDLYGYTKVGLVLDLDQDGAQDLYIVNHLPQLLGSRLLFGHGDATFTSDPDAGLDLSMSGMGLSITDLNGDGLPDLAISGFEEVVVAESVEPRVWANVSAALGVLPGTDQESAWGSAFEDLDNDGLSDLFVTFGQANVGEVTGPNPEAQPDALWVQQADGSFAEEGAAWGLDDPDAGRAAAAVDLDGDGWLDLLTHAHDGPAVYRHARCGDASWSVIRLAMDGPNSHAIGARVRIQAGGVWQTRWVQASGGLFTHLPAEVHFGLGDSERIDTLVIDWPDGVRSRWTDLEARRRIGVRR